MSGLLSALRRVMLSKQGVGLLVLLALLGGVAVAGWRSRSPATYTAAAAIPVHGEPRPTALRETLASTGFRAVGLKREFFRVVPAAGDLEVMERARPALGPCEPDFLDSARRIVLPKFRPIQREIRVIACGSGADRALTNATGYARRWVRLRRRRLRRLFESLVAEAELQAVLKPSRQSEADILGGLIASNGLPEVSLLGNARPDRGSAHKSFPRPVRDGLATSVAVLLVAFGFLSLGWRRGRSSESNRPVRSPPLADQM